VSACCRTCQREELIANSCNVSMTRLGRRPPRAGCHHRPARTFLLQGADADHSWHQYKTVPIDAAGRAAAKGIANSTLLSTKVHRMVCSRTSISPRPLDFIRN
jgi:hypothetical protein